MSRRAVVLVLAAVIAMAVAIPALADSGTTAKTASVKGLSVRALGKAKAALRTARSAKRSVHKAATAATAAQGAAAAAQASATSSSTSAAAALKQATLADEKAGGAQLKAEEAKAAVAGTRSSIGFAEGSVSTESLTFQKLGGPSATLTVPASGLVQVWGQALIEGPGAVSLYEDDHPVEGQAIECNGAKGVLFSLEAPPGEPILAGTPAAFSITGDCATLGAPGPVLFRSTTGEHTFELRYAACSCTGGPPEEATFSERRLVVAPLP